MDFTESTVVSVLTPKRGGLHNDNAGGEILAWGSGIRVMDHHVRKMCVLCPYAYVERERG